MLKQSMHCAYFSQSQAMVVFLYHSIFQVVAFGLGTSRLFPYLLFSALPSRQIPAACCGSLLLLCSVTGGECEVCPFCFPSKQRNNSKPGCHWENPLQEWKSVDLPTMPVTEALLFYYFFSWFMSLKRSLGLFHSINWEVDKSALSAEDIAADRAKAGC